MAIKSTLENPETKKNRLQAWAISALDRDQSPRNPESKRRKEFDPICKQFNLTSMGDAQLFLSQEFTDENQIEAQSIVRKYIQDFENIDKQLRDELTAIVEGNGGQLPNPQEYEKSMEDAIILIINHADGDLEFMHKYFGIIIEAMKQDPTSFSSDPNTMKRLLDRYGSSANGNQYFETQKMADGKPKHTIPLPDFVTNQQLEENQIGVIEKLLQIEHSKYKARQLKTNLEELRDETKR